MIALAADHAGYPLKEEIKKHLSDRGFDVKDFGTDSDKSVDYAVLQNSGRGGRFGRVPPRYFLLRHRRRYLDGRQQGQGHQSRKLRRYFFRAYDKTS